MKSRWSQEATSLNKNIKTYDFLIGLSQAVFSKKGLLCEGTDGKSFHTPVAQGKPLTGVCYAEFFSAASRLRVYKHEDL